MKINEVLEEIEQAYPEDIKMFRPLTKEEIEEHSDIITRASAAMGRHLIKVIREKIEPEQEWRKKYLNRLMALGAHRGEAIESAEAVEYDEDEDPEDMADNEFDLWNEDSE